MTGAPADALGLTDRGTLRPGHAAHITIYDPVTVVETATYENPNRFATGIDRVIVNGTTVLRDGEHTGVVA